MNYFWSIMLLYLKQTVDLIKKKNKQILFKDTKAAN